MKYCLFKTEVENSNALGMEGRDVSSPTNLSVGYRFSFSFFPVDLPILTLVIVHTVTSLLILADIFCWPLPDPLSAFLHQAWATSVGPLALWLPDAFGQSPHHLQEIKRRRVRSGYAFRLPSHRVATGRLCSSTIGHCSFPDVQRLGLSLFWDLVIAHSFQWRVGNSAASTSPGWLYPHLDFSGFFYPYLWK